MASKVTHHRSDSVFPRELVSVEVLTSFVIVASKNEHRNQFVEDEICCLLGEHVLSAYKTAPCFVHEWIAVRTRVIELEERNVSQQNQRISGMFLTPCSKSVQMIPCLLLS